MNHTRASVKTGFATLIVSYYVFSSWCAFANDQICDVSADLALGREDYRTAIVLHRKLLQSRPDNALMHYHLGFAYGMVGQGSEELNEYLTSARLGLRTWDLFLNLGLAYLAEHDLGRAADALETAVSLGAEHAETHYNLALVYENEHRIGEALREITTARRLAPNDPDIANMNAIICAESGDLDGVRDIWIHDEKHGKAAVAAACDFSLHTLSTRVCLQGKPIACRVLKENGAR